MINRETVHRVTVAEEDEEVTEVILLFENENNDYELTQVASYPTRTEMVNHILNMDRGNGVISYQYQVSEGDGEDTFGPLLAEEGSRCNADWWVDELNKQGYLVNNTNIGII